MGRKPKRINTTGKRITDVITILDKRSVVTRHERSVAVTAMQKIYNSCDIMSESDRCTFEILSDYVWLYDRKCKEKELKQRKKERVEIEQNKEPVVRHWLDSAMDNPVIGRRSHNE